MRFATKIVTPPAREPEPVENSPRPATSPPAKKYTPPASYLRQMGRGEVSLSFLRHRKATCQIMRKDITIDELRSNGRQRDVVFARAMIAARMHFMDRISYPCIATAMGRPSHSAFVMSIHRLIPMILESIDHAAYLTIEDCGR